MFTHRLVFPLATVSLLLLSGCNSVHTRPAAMPPPVPVAGNTGSGIPYRLPAGLVTLDFTFPEAGGAADGTIAPTVKVGTSHYPDPTSPFLLLPDHSPFFDTHHKITVSNGLISSIGTTETGRISEAVLSLVETGINVAKIKATPPNFSAQSDAPGATADIFLNDHPRPTDAEIAYALQSAIGTKLSLQLAFGDSTSTPVPLGNSGLLRVERSLHKLDHAGAVWTYGKGADQKPTESLQAGVYTRALRPYRVEAKLMLDRKELNKLRRQAHENELAAVKEERARIKSEADLRKKDLGRARFDHELSHAFALRLWFRLGELQRELARFDLTEPLRKTRTAARDDAEKFHASAKTAADSALSKLVAQERLSQQAETNLRKLETKEALLVARIAKYSPPTPKPPAGATAQEVAPTDAVVLHLVSATVVLPDPDTLIRMPITRATFGTTKNTIKFADGIVTEYDSEQPSSFAGLAALPASMTRAFLQALTGSGSATAPASTATSAAPPAATTPATGSGTP